MINTKGKGKEMVKCGWHWNGTSEYNGENKEEDVTWERTDDLETEVRRQGKNCNKQLQNHDWELRDRSTCAEKNGVEKIWEISQWEGKLC